MDSWYYVIGKDKHGPVEKEEILEMMTSNMLGKESYVWKKGFENWRKIKDVSELEKADLGVAEINLYTASLFEVKNEFDFKNIDVSKNLFVIKTGLDRNMPEQEYGPYSVSTLKSLMVENRINGKTLIFTNGMKKWMFLSDFPELFTEKAEATLISPNERMNASRNPLQAKFRSQGESIDLFGVCRDVSLGGLQILVSGYSSNVGDVLQLKIFQDDVFSFEEIAKITRILEGRNGVTIRFNDLSKKSIECLKKYIEENE